MRLILLAIVYNETAALVSLVTFDGEIINLSIPI